MRPSWIAIAVGFALVAWGMFRVFPERWSPEPAHAILAGMAMYFVAFTGAVARKPQALARPRLPWIGRDGILAGILYRAAFFIAVLATLAYVYFDRRELFDIRWPLLVLAAWTLTDATLNRGRKPNGRE